MLRVPSVDAHISRRIAALEEELAALRAVPSDRRSAEMIPEKIEAVSEVLEYLQRKKAGL